MEYISYNTGTRALPDIYALALGCHAYISARALPDIYALALWRRAYISGKALLSVL